MALVTAICGVGLLSVYLVPSAEAAPYTPKESVVFNNAAGSKAAERRIQTVLDNTISSVPGCPTGQAGCQTITMAMYLFSEKSTADRLIAAHKRGVNVRFLIDNGAWDTSQVKRLRKAFGTSRSASSFVVKCNRGSCMSDYPYATIHVKYYLFSQAGTAKNVSIISSANPHRVNIYNSFNNTHVIPNDPAIYDHLMTYFNDMIKNKQNHTYGNGKDLTSGKYTLYIYPQRRIVAGKQYPIIQYLDVLKTVKCTTASNMGSKGRTVVRMSMWGFTNPRMDVAKKLWSLHNSGCKVDVSLNRGRASRSIMKQLLKKSKKYGKIKLYDAWKDKNRNDYAEQYTHHKAMIINGNVMGKNQRVVWTGSQNLTSNGSLYNDDMVLRITDSPTYFAYSNNFSYIEKKSKRLRSTPPPIILKSHRSDDGLSLTPDQHAEHQAEMEDGG